MKINTHMKGSQSKYHLHIDGKRTTATVDTILSRMYAVKKGVNPFEEDSHTAIRDLLQGEIEKHKVAKSEGVSQTLRYMMIMEITPSNLRSKYFDMSQGKLDI